jgi:hypothetical protein
VLRGNSTENEATHMIGSKYWAVGISVRARQDRDGTLMWGATIDYLDNGFCDDDADLGQVSTQWTLHTRYLVRDGDQSAALPTILDVLIADAAALGVTFRAEDAPGPALFYHRDGVDPEWPPPPGWKELLAEQAARLGWRTLYSPLETPPAAGDAAPVADPGGDLFDDGPAAHVSPIPETTLPEHPGTGQ